jgi:enoyl-CoA hydratase/carnithine racemase
LCAAAINVDLMNATEAHSIGLVNHEVRSEAVDETVYGLARLPVEPRSAWAAAVVAASGVLAPATYTNRRCC